MIAFAFGMLVGLAPVFADDVPTLDVARTCRGISNHALGPSERGGPDLSFADCMKSEQQVHDRLNQEWANYPQAERAQCIAETRVLGVPSYTEVLTCLEMARDARSAGFPPPPSIER